MAVYQTQEAFRLYLRVGDVRAALGGVVEVEVAAHDVFGRGGVGAG
jgi:hypothetical protein